MKKRTWRWVMRGSGIIGSDYIAVFVSPKKPTSFSGNAAMACIGEWSKLFPVPRPGECIKVDFKGTVIP